jgi:FkbM family methyltransferase
MTNSTKRQVIIATFFVAIYIYTFCKEVHVLSPPHSSSGDKHGMGSFGYNKSMTVDAEYHAIHERNAVMVTMSCAANGKYPFYMYGGVIAGWVCKNRGEKAVTAVMVKIFEQECITPSLHSNFMLDIGSNHGYYGLLAMKMGCEALLFDLQPECHQMINNAIVRNNFTARGRLIPRGVTDGEATLMVPSKGCAGRFPAEAHEKQNFNQGDTRVQLNPLTHFIRADQPILMMKVDTEGNEKFVLDGSMHFFERRLIKNAIVELTPELDFWKYVGVTAEDVALAFSHLPELGYTLVSLSDYSVLSTPDDVFNYIMKSRKQFDVWITNSTVAAHDIEAIKV